MSQNECKAKTVCPSDKPPKKEPKCPAERPPQKEPKCEEKPAGFFEFPEALRRIGPKQIAVAVSFIPNMLLWGTTAFVALIYFTDWKVIAKRIPYYNGKFPPDKEPESKPSSNASEDSSGELAGVPSASGSGTDSEKKC